MLTLPLLTCDCMTQQSVMLLATSHLLTHELVAPKSYCFQAGLLKGDCQSKMYWDLQVIKL